MDVGTEIDQDIEHLGTIKGACPRDGATLLLALLSPPFRQIAYSPRTRL